MQQPLHASSGGTAAMASGATPGLQAPHALPPGQHPPALLTLPTGPERECQAMCRRAVARSEAGHDEQALHDAHQAFELARTQRLPQALRQAVSLMGCLHARLGDAPGAQAMGLRALRLQAQWSEDATQRCQTQTQTKQEAVAMSAPPGPGGEPTAESPSGPGPAPAGQARAHPGPPALQAALQDHLELVLAALDSLDSLDMANGT